MEIKNKGVSFEYSIEQKFTAGIALLGAEVKSIRQGKVSFVDSYCTFQGGELWIRNLYIAAFGMQNALDKIDERRDRKLLLQSHELKKLLTHVKEKGYAIVPLLLYENKKHFFKLDIALAKGKKTVDKRHTLKEKQLKREIQSQFKNR